jgi:signal transduction histidine kinase
MSTLRSVIGRLAYLVRCAGIVYVAVQLAIWHTFYLDNPWHLTIPAAAMGWGAAAALYLRWRSPTLILTCVDCAVYVLIALTAQGSIPLGIRGHAYSWLVIIISTQVMVPAWFAPAVLSVPLMLAPSLAYWAGARAAQADTRLTVVTSVMLIMLTIAHRYGRSQLYGRAKDADTDLEMADRAASEQFVILSRNIEYREHERLLHDTVLNTLTALAQASGGDAAGLVNRCRHDVSLIEARLDPADMPAGARPGNGDLIGDVEEVAIEMRARGLEVHVKTAGDGLPVVPATVATAIRGVAREALANVIAHARTGEAWIEISHTATDAGSRLQVTVRDHGIGFDPARIDPARLGLRRSIAERAADCGGQASVWSAPGQGTVVRVSWPAPVPAAVPDWRLVQESPPW